MLSGPHRKFCEGVVSGKLAREAYLAAYPRSKRNSAANSSSRLLGRADIRAEITRLREQADKLAGGAVLSLAEKRRWLARLVRSDATRGEVDGDLVVSCDVETRADGRVVQKIRLPDKMAAIKLDHELSGDGERDSAGVGEDGIRELLGRVRI